MKKRHYSTISAHVPEAVKIGAEEAARKAGARSLSAFLGEVVTARVKIEIGAAGLDQIEAQIEARARAEIASEQALGAREAAS